MPDALVLSGSVGGGVLVGTAGITFDLVVNGNGSTTLFGQVSAGAAVDSGIDIGVSYGAVWGIGGDNSAHGNLSSAVGVEIPTGFKTPLGDVSLALGGQSSQPFNGGALNSLLKSAALTLGWVLTLGTGSWAGAAGLEGGMAFGLPGAVSYTTSSTAFQIDLPKNFAANVPGLQVSGLMFVAAHAYCDNVDSQLGVK